MRAPIRFAVLLVLGAHVLVNGLACGGDDDDGGAGKAGSAGSSSLPNIVLDDVIYEGGVTDEAVASVLGVDPQVDDAKAARLVKPVDSGTIDGSLPTFTFTWNASTAQLAPVKGRSDSWRLPAWLGPERSAHAHGEPFTGVAYLLVFSTPASPALLVVATSATTYTPSADVWAKLNAAKAPITVKMITARLEQNLVAQGGGPFTSSTDVTFTIP